MRTTRTARCLLMVLAFYLHQGHVVQFMRLSEGDDPPIYGYSEGREQRAPTRWYDNLSAWLATELADHLRWTQAHDLLARYC